MKLSFRKYGSGLPLMILHGLFGSGKNWHNIAMMFAKNYQVWTLDLRNHGASAHSSLMNYEVMAEDVHEFIQDHQLPQISLLGHSMGGKVAMLFALKYPKLVERLIIVDIAPVTYYHSYGEYAKAMQEMNLSSMKHRNEMHAYLKAHIASERVRDFLLKNIKRTSHGYEWQIGLAHIAEAIPEIAEFPSLAADHSYPQPTLFIGGNHSDYIRRQYYPAIFQRFPENRIVMIKDAGHWVHSEQTASFLYTVQSYLQTYSTLEKSNTR